MLLSSCRQMGPCPLMAQQHVTLCLHKQVTCDYVAMTPNGRVFDSSLDRGFPYDIRVGAGQVHAACSLARPSLHVVLYMLSCLFSTCCRLAMHGYT